MNSCSDDDVYVKHLEISLADRCFVSETNFLFFIHIEDIFCFRKIRNTAENTKIKGKDMKNHNMNLSSRSRWSDLYLSNVLINEVVVKLSKGNIETLK